MLYDNTTLELCDLLVSLFCFSGGLWHTPWFGQWCFTTTPHWSFVTYMCLCFVSVLECGTPPEPANGKMFYNTPPHWSYVTYLCPCFVSAVDCGTPAEPANGVVFYSSTTMELCDLLVVFLVVDCGTPPEPANGVVFYTSTTLELCDLLVSLFCFSGGLWQASWANQWCGVLQQHYAGLCGDLLMSLWFPVGGVLHQEMSQQWVVVWKQHSLQRLAALIISHSVCQSVTPSSVCVTPSTVQRTFSLTDLPTGFAISVAGDTVFLLQ